MRTNYQNKKRKISKKPKETVDQKIKKALSKIQSKEIHQMLDAVGLAIPYVSGTGVGQSFSNFEAMTTGSNRWNRIGNKITLHGVRINFKLTNPGFVDYGPTTISRTINPITDVKLVLIQLKEPITTWTYSMVKSEILNNGANYNSQSCCVDFGNNSSNRKRFHIVWEKKYRLGQATVPLYDTGTSLVPTPLTYSGYPCSYQVTKWVPGKKCIQVDYDNNSAATRSGGFVLVAISDVQESDPPVFLPPVVDFNVTFYYDP